MKKKKGLLLLGICLIILVTVGLVLFLPSGKKAEEAGKKEAEVSTTETKNGKTPEDKTGEKTGDEKADAGQTATTREAWRTALSEADARREAETEVRTEKPTEKIVDGSGHHEGYLGSGYDIPEGFRDVSPAPTEEGYIYLYQNPEYDMNLQVTEYRLNKRNIAFEAEYSVYHNIYKNDAGTEITYDVVEDNHYVISGYTSDKSRVFYIEGFKKATGYEVQIYSDYPNDAKKGECDAFLEVLQDTLTYSFVTDPASKTEQKTEEITE